jgi:hypothetical protein
VQSRRGLGAVYGADIGVVGEQGHVRPGAGADVQNDATRAGQERGDQCR